MRNLSIKGDIMIDQPKKEWHIGDTGGFLEELVSSNGDARDTKVLAAIKERFESFPKSTKVYVIDEFTQAHYSEIANSSLDESSAVNERFIQEALAKKSSSGRMRDRRRMNGYDRHASGSALTDTHCAPIDAYVLSAKTKGSFVRKDTYSSIQDLWKEADSHKNNFGNAIVLFDKGFDQFRKLIDKGYMRQEYKILNPAL